MAKKVTGPNIESEAIQPYHLTLAAKESVLDSRLSAFRTAVVNFAFPSGESSAVVTTEVEAVALVSTRQSSLSAGEGIYIGAVSGASDHKRVLIRATGTDNGIDDGTGDDLYAVLVDTAGVLTLELKQSNGSAYVTTEIINLDFFFVEIFTDNTRPVDAGLRSYLGGVIDASTIDKINQVESDLTQAIGDLSTDLTGAINAVQGNLDLHEDGNPSKHDASEIDYERLDDSRVSITTGTISVETALANLDDEKLSNIQVRVTSESAINLASPPSEINGVTLLDNDLVLLVAQTDPAENGVYRYLTGAMARWMMVKASQFRPGVLVSSIQDSKIWFLTSTVVTLGTDPIDFLPSGTEQDTMLKVLEHPTNKQRVIITPSYQVLGNGEVLIQELNLLPMFFNGAQIDFSTGEVFEGDGVTPLGFDFTPPAIVATKYRWCTVTIIAASVDVLNRSVGKPYIFFGTADGDTADGALRAPWLGGKPLAQISVQGAVAGYEPIYQLAIQRLSIGSGGGGAQSEAIKEVPVGVIDGVNDTFTLSTDPLSPSMMLVFLDRGVVPQAAWGLQNGNELIFGSSDIPQVGQYLEVWYLPDPLALLGGGGGGGGTTDLTNIPVNIQPDVSGLRSVGTGTKPWKDVYLKDKTTGDVYRLEVDNGVLQAELIVP